MSSVNCGVTGLKFTKFLHDVEASLALLAHAVSTVGGRIPRSGGWRGAHVISLLRGLMLPYVWNKISSVSNIFKIFVKIFVHNSQMFETGRPVCAI